MDLEEVYLRQIDQKLKQNNELQEETNRLVKELLSELKKNQEKRGTLLIPTSAPTNLQKETHFKTQ